MVSVGWQTKTPNVHMAEESSGAWLEVFMASMARDCVAKAKEQVGSTTRGRPDHSLPVNMNLLCSARLSPACASPDSREEPACP